MPTGHLIQVLLHTPAYSQMAGAFTYLSDSVLPPGALVRVPLGQRELLGVVWDQAPAQPSDSALDPAKLRPVSAALDSLPPLNANWRALTSFAASYYQRAAGEVALAALPPQLRDMSSLQLARKLKKLAKAAAADASAASQATCPAPKGNAGNTIH
ncbi:MAG TPA: primosomal protein N', partial [Rhodoferax sp.]|nr:primosomal protein N' [Rhodoferax sp.]